MPTQVKQERIYGLDLLRILSMFMVVFLHVSLFSTGIKNFESKPVLALFYSITYCAVNCFGMLSGYVGVKSDFRYGKLFSLWKTVFFYSVVITLVYCFVSPEQVTKDRWLGALFPCLTRQYWYFSGYAFVCVLLPLINPAICAMPEKRLFQVVLAGFLLFSVSSLVPKFTFSSALFNKYGYSGTWLFFLYILGGYLRLYGDKLRIPKPSLCFGVCFVLINLFIWAVPFAVNYTLRLYINPFVLLSAVMLLLIFSRWKIKNGVAVKVITTLSPLAFSVYLIHEHSLIRANVVTGLLKNFTGENSLLLTLRVLAVTLCIYLACSAIDYVRLRLFRLCRIK